LGYSVGIGSSAGGIIALTVADSIANSLPNFTPLASVFDEWRICGLHVVVESYNKYSKTTTLSTPIFMVHDGADSTALSTYAQAAEYGNAVISNTDDLWPRRGVYFSKTNDEAANVWQPTSTNTVIGSVKWYSANLSASITYGQIFIKYLVEFRLLV